MTLICYLTAGAVNLFWLILGDRLSLPVQMAIPILTVLLAGTGVLLRLRKLRGEQRRRYRTGALWVLLLYYLCILSVLLLGAKLGIRTIVAALLTPLLMNTMSRLVYPTREALESLDPAQLLGGSMNMTDHLMLTCIIGAVVIGVGTGIVIRSQATTGGSDIVGMLLQKYAHIRFSRAILLVDGAVVCFGLVVIGFGLGTASDSTQPSFYSLISIFIISRVIAYMINGAKNDKLIFVISDHELQPLHQYILKDLDRTATCIKSSGLYTGKDKEMIFLVVSYQEVQGVKLKIKEADPRAFVVVTDAYDTFGEGWKQLPSPHEIYPE